MNISKNSFLHLQSTTKEGIQWLNENRFILQTNFLLSEGLKSEIFKEYLKQTQLKQLSWLAEFKNIISNLNKAKLTFIPFKGPTLSYMLYSEWNCRQFRDLDFIFPDANSLIAAITVLEEIGYRPVYKLLPHQVEKYFLFQKDIKLQKPGTPFLLEFHLKLLPGSLRDKIMTEDVFSSKKTIETELGRISIPDTNVLIKYLFFHGEVHQWQRLHWLYDFLKLYETRSKSHIRLPEERIEELRNVFTQLSVSEIKNGKHQNEYPSLKSLNQTKMEIFAFKNSFFYPSGEFILSNSKLNSKQIKREWFFWRLKDVAKKSINRLI